MNSVRGRGRGDEGMDEGSPSLLLPFSLTPYLSPPLLPSFRQGRDKERDQRVLKRSSLAHPSL